MATAGFRRQTLAPRHDAYRRRAPSTVQNRPAFREMRDHIAHFWARVQLQHSFADHNGQILTTSVMSGSQR